MSQKKKPPTARNSRSCPFYDKCSLRLHPLAATDNPNAVAHLGWRTIYTLIAWLVLGYKVSDGFFLAMCFFVLPVLMDCIKFTPLNKTRKWIRKVEIAVVGALFIVSLLGVIGIYTLKMDGDSWRIVTEDFIGWLPSGFDVSIMWGFLITVVGTTLVDWICNETKLDDAVNR